METFLIKAAQLILAFAILVIIHEFGHFLFARIFGIRVNRFYMFFNPITSIFKWRPGKYYAFFGKKHHFNKELDVKEAEVIAEEKKAEEIKKRNSPALKELNSRLSTLKLKAIVPGSGHKLESEIAEIKSKIASLNAESESVEAAAYASRRAFEEEYYYNKGTKKANSFWKNTEYGMGWLPLGGYCQISGMIDESMDTEQMKQPAKSWEFRSKPAWQRLLVMVAGVLFNFLLAMVIYAGITWWWGDDHVALKDTNGFLKYSEVAQQAGFRDGDIPLSADGKPLSDLGEEMYALASARKVTLLRNGSDTVTLTLPSDFMMRVEKSVDKDPRGISFVTMDIPVVVQSITNESSRAAGLRQGDEIIAINDTLYKGATAFLPALEGRAGKTVDITVLRRAGNAVDTVVLPIKLDGASKIGFQLENDMRKLFNVTTERYGFFESFPVGISKGVKKMVDYVSSLKYVFTKEGAQSVGGFGAIGNMFPEKWNWFAFWNIAAFLSVALAFMNILPIPALDGGHVLFLLYEVVFRRPPGQKFMERAQITGMMLLILLLLYANGMDLVRFFIK